jgi:electron transfer flavoprotein alpha subunit
MSVVVFAENSEGKFKKAVFEAVTYAYKTAQTFGLQVTTIVIGETEAGETDKLAQYGASKVIKVAAPNSVFQPQQWSHIIANVFQQAGGKVLVFSNTYTGKALAPQVAVKTGASLATNVISLPVISDKFVVTRAVFSGKGFADVALDRELKIIALMPNSIDLEENKVDASVENMSVEQVSASLEVLEVNTVKGKIPLTEAEIVVSGGRGMKGPENWYLIEQLAEAIGASTACSKPVSDMDWRPHSEHVGQTGITIKPNLYIAIGISGAIQHLAGVSSSKVIVVINKDPEAPFFKAADYGIVGDAFEILPKLIKAAGATSNA